MIVSYGRSMNTQSLRKMENISSSISPSYRSVWTYDQNHINPENKENLQFFLPWPQRPESHAIDYSTLTHATDWSTITVRSQTLLPRISLIPSDHWATDIILALHQPLRLIIRLFCPICALKWTHTILRLQNHTGDTEKEFSSLARLSLIKTLPKPHWQDGLSLL